MDENISINFISDFASRRVLARTPGITGRQRRMRLALIGLGCLGWLGLLISRLYSLQISDFEKWQDWAVKQHLTQMRLASERGAILDREGKLLAASVPAGSVYARPGQIRDKDKVIKTLAPILEMEPQAIRRQLEQSKPFVWLKRQIPRAVSEQIASLNLPGVGYLLEAKRLYPYNQAASALIGRVGIDGVGLSGIELQHEERLQAEHLNTLATRDAFGNMIQVPVSNLENFELPRGSSLQLTVDAGLETILDEELEEGRKATKAGAVLGVLVDAESGEILALGQSPAVNFNLSEKVDKNSLKNLVVETVFEPGSVMKPIVAAAALDAGVVGLNESINCERGRLLFARRIIRDTHPVGEITFRDVIVRSSNIGMTKVGVRLGRERLYNTLRNFGFGESVGLGLPGETKGILRSEKDWAQIDVATHSFGQGVAVTPLQMVRAISALANGGILPKLHLVMDEEPPVGERIISERTSDRIRDVLYGVVEDKHGTGHLAAIPGVRVGGKTGTAQKAIVGGRGYKEGAYVASFVGFADGATIGLPKKLTLMVVVDEPNTTSIYGGTLAAPIFRRIMQRSLSYLNTRQEIEIEGGDQIVPELRPNPGYVPIGYRQ